MLDERGVKENLRTRFPTDRKPYTTRYDYEDDSDLEEDDDSEDISDDNSTSVPQVVTEKSGNSDVVVLENSDAKSNEPSDILSVSDLDSVFSESSDTGDSRNRRFRSRWQGRRYRGCGLRHVGPFSHLPGACTKITCNRFQALLRYLYTDEIRVRAMGFRRKTQGPCSRENIRIVRDSQTLTQICV